MGRLVKCGTCGARTPFAEAWFWAMAIGGRIAVVGGFVTQLARRHGVGEWDAIRGLFE